MLAHNEDKSLALEADEFPEKIGSEESFLPASILVDEVYQFGNLPRH